jgi:hypothetical protein
MRLRRLRIELAATTRTPEEEAAIRARMAEHIKTNRLMSLSPGVPDCFWREEERMGEQVRVLVAA